MSWPRYAVMALAQVCAVKVSASCWTEVADRYSIEPQLLFAIADVESKLDPRAVNQNRNGSRDVGLMQINSLHLPKLKSRGITEQRLLNEPCLAIDVGASILSEFIARHGYNWTAVGAYNAGSAANREPLRRRYALKVYKRYKEALAEGSVPYPF